MNEKITTEGEQKHNKRLLLCIIRELKQWTFSGRWRLDRQREVGTDVTVASCQN